ncbi:excinuclease ABC, C subunit [Treponema sp. JC4]|uniref:excinuclease ABC subunit UvrC n=1 Tax=Treponema sp. JC4 TaxID=1124982 RepID=UPI00025AFDAE|nr:excinuclease ABC subunit UvrC [Treponema sp. JC4]EID84325.1 excinuclease ABC, C subunit [Treponema sp. JC4]
MPDKTASTREILHQTALKAPLSSGVYLWRNAENTVIYVGKAKNLKNRLSSYFSGQKNIKTRLLVSHATSIEYITTANEYEALLLENNLIKKYNPRYNIDLKDGKSYPSLKITREDFPRIFKTRHLVQDGARYFGPYPDVYALDTFIETIFKLYPVRHCKTLRNRDAPCLYYHMKQCKAPCCKKIDKESYNEYIGEIAALLEGKGDETIEKLTAQMKAAAAELNFEKAARLRDGIKALMIMQNQNVVETFDSDDRDYIAYWSEGELVSFTVLKIRSGKLLARENYRAESLNDDDDLVGEFMAVYYDNENIPPAVYIAPTAQYEIIDKWLDESFAQARTKLHLVATEHSARELREACAKAGQTPSTDGSEGTSGEMPSTNGGAPLTPPATLEGSLANASISTAPRDIAAIQMARQNAHEDIIRRLRERGDTPAMEELKNLLGLPNLPVRIEGFDIAHIGGKFPVASLISFYNGNPDKKNYRYFRLKTTDGLIDDFQSMREAVSRRYSRLLNEGQELPDLLLIDGGIGQVNAVDGILKALGVEIPIAGLAKRDEEIWRPYASEPIRLPRRSDGLRLLQRVRDETHRFATSRNQTLRTKENTKSIFLELPGVGEKRTVQLQKAFTTLEDLAAAPESAIAQAIHVRAQEAADILLSAKNLLSQRKEKQELQRLSLGQSGTTKEKAAEAQYLSDLADQALAVAEDKGDYK